MCCWICLLKMNNWGMHLSCYHVVVAAGRGHHHVVDGPRWSSPVYRLSTLVIK